MLYCLLYNSGVFYLVKGVFMDSIKFSVIIPVYNVEKYLNKCIDSILIQSYSNYEIILINDGSTDTSPDICLKYIKNNKKIRYITQENKGLSEARNSGLRVATGDYILFIDSDDFYDDNYFLEKLSNRLLSKKTDILNFSYKKVDLINNKSTSYFNKKLTLGNIESEFDIVNYISKNRLYIASACNKAINAELFKNNDLFFRKDIFSEDIEWCARLLHYAKTIDFINIDAYCYCQHSLSITHTINNKKCTDLCNNIISCINFAETIDTKKKNLLLAYTAYQMGTFFKVQALSDSIPIGCIKKLSKYSYILKYHNFNKKIFLLYLLTRIFSFEFCCKIFRIIF